ncbi:hypothetical protein BU17DRAFT_80294 [Hysterangium stoloniferum]|nr:hypothetical protein BU17DRAFT_80294 [Hysterangium stoloniferum]
MIIPPGDDEPPEPVPEAEDCGLTLVDGGVRFMLHASALVTKLRIAGSSPKPKMRNIRAWRPNMSVAAARDDRRRLQLLATIWRESVSSVKCDFPLHTLHGAVQAFPFQSVDALVATDPLISPLDTPVVPEAPVGEGLMYALTSRLLSTFTKFYVPLIIVTPPADDSYSMASLCNGAAVPQDAAFGNRLTVPDPDSAVVNSRDHARCCLEVLGGDKNAADPMYQDGESGSADTAIDRNRGIEFSQGLEDEDEDELDLARTWCG